MEEMTSEEYLAFIKMSEAEQARWLMQRAASSRLRQDIAVVRATTLPAPQASPNERPKVLEELADFLEWGNYGRVWQEHMFHPTRRWRADFWLPDQTPPVAIEYDGLMRHGENQGHASISGILRDVEKANEITAMGYRLFRANAKNLADGSFYELLSRVLREVTDGHEG